MDDRYSFITSVLKAAGQRVLIALQANVTVDIKNNDRREIVTNVDVEVSEFITKAIQNQYPGEIIYSEEAPNVDVSAGSYWSIDPIDGTACFSRNIPHYAVVMAYVESGIPVAGGVYNPQTRELYSFNKGQGTFLNDQPVQVSTITDLNQAHVFLRVGRNPEQWLWGLNAYRYLLEHANKTANFGSSALDMCFVGAGRIEASIYGNLTSIDIAAAIGFVREAGGLIVGQDGQNITKLSLDKQPIIAVNNHQILLRLKQGLD